MTLTIPGYIVQSEVCGAPVTYVWRGTRDYNHESKTLGPKLYGLTARACLACATAMAEWVLWRLQPLSDFAVPAQLMEAAWAANIDVRYCKIPKVSEFQERKGEVDGVLRTAKNLLEGVLRSYDTPSAQNVAGRTVYLFFLARHVMPNTKPFDAWLKSVIERCTKLYPRPEGDIKGEPVPREAMDPNFDFPKDQAPALIAQFLAGLDPKVNPYLRTAEEMRAAGFPGTPYR